MMCEKKREREEEEDGNEIRHDGIEGVEVTKPCFCIHLYRECPGIVRVCFC